MLYVYFRSYGGLHVDSPIKGFSTRTLQVKFNEYYKLTLRPFSPPSQENCWCGTQDALLSEEMQDTVILQLEGLVEWLALSLYTSDCVCVHVHACMHDLSTSECVCEYIIYNTCT